MILVVVRHGETDLNKENRLQGSRGIDYPLNATGRSQVIRLRDALLITPEIIYTSPLKRTMETTAILAERFLPLSVVQVNDLKERDFGSLSGKLRTEVGSEILKDDLEGRYDYRPYGGESINDVTQRIRHFLDTLELESKETVLVVTHRGIIRILYDLYPETAGGPILPGSKHVFRVTQKPS